MTDPELLERCLSVERLGPYRRAAGGDLSAALRLYEWNSAVAAAFFELLGYFEVILRNAMSEQLAAEHAHAGRPGYWYDDPDRRLDDRRHTEIAEARTRLRNEGKPETPGRILAQLSFGFWRQLLDRKYQTTLWAQALRHAFPYAFLDGQPQRRQVISQPVHRLNDLRNRIAHHEPIYHLDLVAHHSDLASVVGFVDPVPEAWLRRIAQTALARPPWPFGRK